MPSFEPSFLRYSASLAASEPPVHQGRMCRHACLVLLLESEQGISCTQTMATLVVDLQRSMGANKVRMAYMGHGDQGLYGQAEQAIHQGACHLWMLPLCMTSAGLLAYPFPLQIRQLRHAYPNVEIGLLPPVGYHPQLSQAVEHIARTALSLT